MDSLRYKILSRLHNKRFQDRIDPAYEFDVKVFHLDDEQECKNLFSKIQGCIKEVIRKHFFIFLLKFKQTHWMTTVIKQGSGSQKTRAYFFNSHLDPGRLQPNKFCTCETWIIDFIQAVVVTSVFGRDRYRDRIDELVKISMMNKQDVIRNTKIREKYYHRFLDHQLSVSTIFSDYEELYTYAVLLPTNLGNPSEFKKRIKPHRLRIENLNLNKHFIIMPLLTNARDNISMVILQNGSEESIDVFVIHSREGDQGRDEGIIETDFGLLQSILGELFHSYNLVRLSVNMEDWKSDQTWIPASITAIMEAVIIVYDCTKFIDMPPKSPLLLTHVTAEMEQCIKAITVSGKANDKKELEPTREEIHDEECIQAEDRASENEMNYQLDIDNIGYLLYTKCNIDDQQDDILPVMDINIKDNPRPLDTSNHIDSALKDIMSAVDFQFEDDSISL
ncbi:hypothetical protein TrispH2_011831, partial [Trichoplax sp. H2]